MGFTKIPIKNFKQLSFFNVERITLFAAMPRDMRLNRQGTATKGKMVAQEQTEIQAKSVFIRPYEDWVRSG